jgi:predicted peptidase
MKRRYWLLALVLAFSLVQGCATPGHPPLDTASAPVAEVATGFINKTLADGECMKQYVVYVPLGYSRDRDWPMIVFLHGAGERGSDGLLQTEVGLGTAIRRNAQRWPAIVLMPQCPKDQFWDSILGDLDRAMEQTRNAYRVDPDRIYLTGLSMGGYGTWIWGALKADTFAALMPICGGGDVTDIKKLLGVTEKDQAFGTLEERVKRLATVPIWAFHGADDTTVPPARTQQMVQLVRDAGGKVEYTEFPHTGHNSWDRAYGEPKTARWLFDQRRN